MSSRLSSLPDRLAARPALWRAVFVAAFAVLVLAVLAYTFDRYLKTVEKPSKAGTLTRTAFLRWKPQIEALDAGENIYQKYQYPNPPIMALILRPFVSMPAPDGAIVWFLLKVALAVVAFVWVFRLAAEPGRPFPAPAWVMTVVLAIHPLLGDLSHGNVNIAIAFLVFASLELFRRRFDLTAGLVLALAIACKVTPALFVPYFGWKLMLSGWTAFRERTSILRAVWQGGGAVLAGCVVGLGVWLIALPGAALGFERNQVLLTSWFDQMVRPFVVDGKVTSEHANQSIPGLVFRLLTHEPSDSVEDDDGKMTPSEYHNVADIGPGGAKWIIRGCQVVFVAVVFFLGRAPITRQRQGLRVAAELALVTLGMLLFSERTWKHHATVLMLPMAVLVGWWTFRSLSAVTRLVWILGVVTIAALMLVPSVGGEFQDTCLVYGSHTAAFVLLTVGVTTVMRVEANLKDEPSS